MSETIEKAIIEILYKNGVTQTFEQILEDEEMIEGLNTIQETLHDSFLCGHKNFITLGDGEGWGAIINANEIASYKIKYVNLYTAKQNA